MEHIHTLPFPWELKDDFNRALAWRSLGVDDVLDVSVPWSTDPNVMVKDSRRPAGPGEQYPVLAREYRTPKGNLRHEIRQTGEHQAEGWVIQPDVVPLIEDFNIPRAVRQLVSTPRDVGPLSFCYRPPDAAARSWFAERMDEVKKFRDAEGVPVQAWSGFGMDAVVWFCGTEGAIMLAMDAPKEFGELFEAITETDVARDGARRGAPGYRPPGGEGVVLVHKLLVPRPFPNVHPSPHPRPCGRGAPPREEVRLRDDDRRRDTGPGARGGRSGRVVLRGSPGPCPEGALAGESAGSALIVHDAGRGNQLDCVEQP